MFDNVKSAGAAQQVEDFGRAFVDSAIQRPGNAARELINWYTGSPSVPKLEIVEPPKKNTLGAQLGDVTGQALNIFLLSKAFNAGARMTSVGIGENALRFGSAGFFHGSVLTSSADQPGNFLLNRLSNGVIEGGTWATIGGTASTLTQIGSLSKSMLNSRAGFVANSAVSGGTGGIVNAELDARINHRRFATLSEIGDSVLQYGAAGAITGGLNWKTHSNAVRNNQELTPHLIDRYTSY